jgi:hypothetical protein
LVINPVVIEVVVIEVVGLAAAPQAVIIGGSPTVSSSYRLAPSAPAIIANEVLSQLSVTHSPKSTTAPSTCLPRSPGS